MLRFSQASVLASLLVTSSNGATTTNDRRPQPCFLTCTSESSEAAEVTDNTSNLRGAAGPSHVRNSIESMRFFFIFMFYLLAPTLCSKDGFFCNTDYVCLDNRQNICLLSRHLVKCLDNRQIMTMFASDCMIPL